jgi:hypothetical protein
MEDTSNFINNLLDPLFSNQIISLIVQIFLILYASKAIPNASIEIVSKAMNSYFFRFIAIFLISWTIIKDPSMGILLAFCFLGSINFINNKGLFENFSFHNTKDINYWAKNTDDYETKDDTFIQYENCSLPLPPKCIIHSVTKVIMACDPIIQAEWGKIGEDHAKNPDLYDTDPDLFLYKYIDYYDIQKYLLLQSKINLGISSLGEKQEALRILNKTSSLTKMFPKYSRSIHVKS